MTWRIVSWVLGLCCGAALMGGTAMGRGMTVVKVVGAVTLTTVVSMFIEALPRTRARATRAERS